MQEVRGMAGGPEGLDRMKRIRAGIIGMGGIGLAQLEAVRRLGYAEVAAVAVRDREKARGLCDFYGIPKSYTDYRELLADGDIDVVHNCTPNDIHFSINRDIILAGKQVLSEKPLTIDSGDSRELLRLLESHNVKNAVNFVYRHYSMVRHARGMIEGGELGEIYAIRGTYLQDWLLYDTDWNWRVDESAGGPSRALADIGSHWIDLARFLLGAEIVEVCADLATFLPTRKQLVSSNPPVSRNVDVKTEDYGSVLMRFERGIRGQFTVSQTSAGRKLGLSFDIDGSKASLHWEHDQADRLWIGHRDSPNGELILHPGLLNEAGRHAGLRDGKVERWPEAQKHMIDSFYRDLLEGGKRRYADFSDGHRVVETVEAILRSDRNRAWESLG